MPLKLHPPVPWVWIGGVCVCEKQLSETVRKKKKKSSLQDGLSDHVPFKLTFTEVYLELEFFPVCFLQSTSELQIPLLLKCVVL